MMNRPSYVGFTILELSKVLMYKFHYEQVKSKYQNNAELLFTDTDSLTYIIQTEDLYQDMLENKQEYDFSDYPKTNPLYSEDNKKVVGKFKDEMNGEKIYEFFGLKPKMYSILSKHEEKKRAKGVSTRVVKKKLTHDDYKDCLFNPSKKFYRHQKRIGQENHLLFTMNQNKVSLNSFDDKRYLWDDGINSYAYGHHSISSKQE